MSDWKSEHGVTQEGANRAGIHTVPNSTLDISRAQNETQNAYNEAAKSNPLYSSAVQPTVYSPSSVPTSGYVSEAEGCLAMVKALAFCAAIIIVGFVLYQFANHPNLIKDLVNSNSDASQTLNTTYYESLSESAANLSSTPASQLYKQRLTGATTDWKLLNSKQKLAVQSSWIRYTRNPESFSSLPLHQEIYFKKAFNSYLICLKAEGDAQASEDLIYLSQQQR